MGAPAFRVPVHETGAAVPTLPATPGRIETLRRSHDLLQHDLLHGFLQHRSPVGRTGVGAPETSVLPTGCHLHGWHQGSQGPSPCDGERHTFHVEQTPGEEGRGRVPRGASLATNGRHEFDRHRSHSDVWTRQRLAVSRIALAHGETRVNEVIDGAFPAGRAARVRSPMRSGPSVPHRTRQLRPRHQRPMFGATSQPVGRPRDPTRPQEFHVERSPLSSQNSGRRAGMPTRLGYSSIGPPRRRSSWMVAPSPWWTVAGARSRPARASAGHRSP